MKIKSIIYKVLAVIIGIFSLYIMTLDNFSTFYLTVGTLVLLVAVVLYILSSPKTYNTSVSSTKQVANPNNLSIKELYEAFKSIDSSMGKPWLGKLKTLKGDCLILGPTQEGEFLYIHKFFNNFSIGINNFPKLLVAPEGEGWRLEREKRDLKLFSDEEAICYSLMHQTMVEDMLVVLEAFSHEKRILPLPNIKNPGKLYRIDEKFIFTGQKFHFKDFENNPMYEIEATFPLLSFSVRDYQNQNEIFRMQKKIINVMSTYEFFLNNEEYGIFKQKVDFIHDIFEMDTKDGKLQMCSINDKFGTNYVVKMDNVVIGSIAERFNLTVHNIFFDNFIIHVRDNKYTALMAGLAVMAARELSRDRSFFTTNIFSNKD